MMLSIKNRKLGLVNSFSITKKVCLTYNKRDCTKQGCWKYCYCNHMNKLYPTYSAKMRRNYWATKRKTFVDEMVEELKDSTDMIRIHVEGDFYSQKYLNDWFLVCKAYPHKTFYCYTKAKRLDFSKRPKNLIVYLSDDKLIWQKHHNRFDGVATISFDKNKISGFAQCKNQQDKSVTCNECRLCTRKGMKVYFNKH